ncbi:hypothetical protein [Aliiruegeria sabulilitoris]|uniref:hypothetical protein n=1 Tax=Aliiruegeria sabulilitoris TaxID=1510458 RepID=UPI00082EF9F1|nr:hypothetical protein [Aliiruegeria sabulilitoris]NDR57570.1 hypothetical protein [Pseudoruegeria sp. M32A2M]
MNNQPETWRANRATYIRDHVVISVVGAIGTCLVLWWLGNADWWVGLIAAPMAMAIRGFYLASEELALSWVLTDGEIQGSQGKRIALRDISKVRSFGSSVQVITRSGDKHLIKYLSDPAALRARIENHISRAAS